MSQDRSLPRRRIDLLTSRVRPTKATRQCGAVILRHLNEPEPGGAPELSYLWFADDNPKAVKRDCGSSWMFALVGCTIRITNYGQHTEINIGQELSRRNTLQIKRALFCSLHHRENYERER